MATKILSRRTKVSTARPRENGARKLRKLIDKHRALAEELAELLEELEDAEDGRSLQEAIKRNKGKPLIPWAEAKKRLGLG